MIQEGLRKVIKGENLIEPEMIGVMKEIMGGEATPAQIGAFLAALRIKGETVAEITGAARVMREHALKIKIPATERVVDTCGTGGDGSNTFNISTASAFVAAGAGITVAKHGNRSVSSRCGSANVLAALGVNIQVETGVVEQCLKDIGIGFLFAPSFHQAMKHVAGPRREMGIRTIFNILGPLTNPAGAQCQVLGVYDEKLTELMAEVLRNLGSLHVFVIRGEDGLDEFTLAAPTRVSELKDGAINTYLIHPEELGLRPCSREDLLGGDANANAAIIRDILDRQTGAPRDVVLLNSAAAVVAGGKAKDLAGGLRLAAESIDSGKARAKLDALIEVTN